MKTFSLEDVTDLEDLERPTTTSGIELLRFAPLGRQNGFCVHESSEEEQEVDTDTLVTSV